MVKSAFTNYFQMLCSLNKCVVSSHISLVILDKLRCLSHVKFGCTFGKHEDSLFGKQQKGHSVTVLTLLCENIISRGNDKDISGNKIYYKFNVLIEKII